MPTIISFEDLCKIYTHTYKDRKGCPSGIHKSLPHFETHSGDLGGGLKLSASATQWRRRVVMTTIFPQTIWKMSYLKHRENFEQDNTLSKHHRFGWNRLILICLPVYEMCLSCLPKFKAKNFIFDCFLFYFFKSLVNGITKREIFSVDSFLNIPYN